MCIRDRIHDSATIGMESRAERKLREILMGRGYVEILNYSFISPKFTKDLMLPPSDLRAMPFPLANPLSVEQSVMRTFLLPGLAYAICDNLRKGWRFPIRIFEIGNVFLKEGTNLREEKHIAGAIFLGKDDRSPYGVVDKDDFFTIKGDLVALAKAFRLHFDILPGDVYKRQVSGANSYLQEIQASPSRCLDQLILFVSSSGLH